MRRQLLPAVAVILLLAPSLSAQPAKETAKTRKVRELLTLMKAGDMGVQVMDNMMGAMKSTMPDVPEEFWTGFRREIKPGDLMEMIIPIYERNLEEGDIDELLKFYNSPSGKRFVSKQSIILQEAMAAGQQWGEQLAERAVNKLREKGLIPKQ